MASLLHLFRAPDMRRRRRSSTLRHTVSGVALIAGSMSLAALASPAQAQCVENPANVYTCSGSLDTTQTLTGPTAAITTIPGFTVDTISNGGGSTFVVNAQGLISYIDIEGSRLAGGGAYFTSDTGDIVIVSTGEIDSDLGLQGLGLETLNGGDIDVTWTGHIDNSSGEGVRAVGTGAVNMLLSSVRAQDGAVEITQNGPGGVSLLTTGDVTSLNGRGVAVTAGAASTGDISLNLRGVAATDRGVYVLNQGAGATFIRAAGPISGSFGISATNDPGSGELYIDVADVTGSVYAARSHNYGISDTFVRTRDVFSETNGLAIYNGETAGSLTIIARNVSTGSTGVAASNQGTGGASITVEGSVTSGGIGVQAFNDVLTQNLFISTQDIQAGSTGIHATQDGTGSLVIEANGAVVGQGNTGIRINTGVQATGVTLTAQDIAGDDWGLLIDHAGSGGVQVTAAGDIVGALDAGVWVVAGPASGYVTLDLQGVSGGTEGVRVNNGGLGGTVIRAADAILANGTGIHVENEAGSGELLIDVAGVGAGDLAVSAVNNGVSNTFIRTGDLLSFGKALDVENGATAGDLTVITGNVHGETVGLSIDNNGTGDTRVTSTGTVTGLLGMGINVQNGQQNQGGLFINAENVMAGDGGIRASHAGAGLIDVKVTGWVTGGGGDGVQVHAGAQGAGVSVTAVDVRGGQDGVAVENFGTGNTLITTTGLVWGEQQDGVSANNGQNAGHLIIDVMDAIGASNGIAALNQGAGEISITVRGVAQGASAGVSASSLTGGAIAIDNLGGIRNDTATSSERAVYASGGAITVNNAGGLIGTVDLWGDSVLLFNGGAWDSSNGESLFNGADDRVVNSAGGLIFAAGDAFTAETTTWTGLERFDSEAMLSLIDGGAGDVLLTSADTTFQAGSVLGVDFGGVASDVFRTEGTLDIQAGAQLSLNQVGALTLHDRYVVAEAAQGLTGEFDFDEVFLTAFAGLTDGYNATQAYVEFAQLRALAEAGLTPNQKAAAGGADSLPDGDAVKDALLMLPSDEVARDAFDLLSGEVHATARTATMEDSRLPRDAVLDRLSEADGSGAAWARVFEGRGVSDGDYNAASGERDARGVMAGVDRTFAGTATVGVAMGVLKSEVDVNRRASTAEVESVHGLVYGGVAQGAWRVSGGLGYARTVTETRREIAFPGFAGTPTADYDGSVLQGFVEAGYRMPARGGWVEPFAALAAVRVQSDAFVEDGGPEALSGERITEDAVISTLGLRFETNPMGPFSLRGVTGWRRNWGDTDPVGRHAFEGGDVFEVLGAAQSENAAVARVEAHWRLSPRVGFGLAYDGVMGDDGADHAITGAFKVVF